ncbi:MULTISPECIES: sigma-70 family RNA polymerase sigma factor [unclassified Paenibacillus]|uniref:RNA polymerase sigma factor n=1 Tax=unclassified Paenibacillus TaxID=185978 RepID=UPI00104E4A79|nr:MULTISPECIES: sigma-70 family RNA polymerase sigma factor [unclassified Paenibacillus]NIK68269.1 RNA polymerase sigma-70 factor (ECF subfamily) [Paenibacillus sp. BK720]TCM99516.1 RNA polymerase sigma-70 factor (ECF subfamily) [Paenibacillus sp. BK033]
MSRLEDMSEVLRDMCEGETEAFDRFYARYAPLVMQVALRTLGERMEAEDVCHDVFLEVLRRGKDYNPGRGSLEAWLAVMTRSRCLDRLRRAKRIAEKGKQLGQDTASSGRSSEEIALRHLELEELNEALKKLPRNQRNAVAYSYYSPHTQKELSDAWNVPLGTVKSWVRYGLNNMRKHLERRGSERTTGVEEGRR